MRWSFIYGHWITRYVLYIVLITIILLLLGISSSIKVNVNSNQIYQNSLSKSTRSSKSLSQYDVSIPLNNNSQVIIDGAIAPGEYEGTYEEPTTHIMTYWEHNGVNLSVGLVSLGLGWVSLGIGDHKTGSNIIFGGSDGGASYCYDQTGQADYSHPNDTTLGGTYDILNFEALENGTHTTLEFIMPLNTTDSLDPIMQMNETIDMFFAYHATSDDTQQFGHIRSGYVTVLIQSVVITIRTGINITIPASITQGENFTIQATLANETAHPMENYSIVFFRETQFANYEIATKTSNSFGVASIIYSNQYLLGNYTFGVQFKELRIGNIVYAGSKNHSTIFFSSEGESERDPAQDLFFDFVELSVWAVLIFVWSVYGYILFILLRLRNKKQPNLSKNEINES